MSLINLPLRYKAILKILLGLLRGEKYYAYSFYQSTQKTARNTECFSLLENNKLAIVVQGPYSEKENFTLETLRIYRRNFPESVIILSTWTVPECDESALKQIDVKVILNERPIYSGVSNVNLQIVSTKLGMLLAKELGANHALKTRTDQRIYNPNFYAYLTSLLYAFPLANACSDQYSRLIACSLNTFKLRMYGISDMFLFGHIEDMVRYWDVPFDDRNSDGIENKKTWREHASLQLSEVYFCTTYLRSIGKDVKFTLKSSLSAIAENFIVIDQHSISLFWNKYTYDENRYDHGFYNSQLTFNDWLILDSCQGNIVYDEKRLDLKISNKR
jgi:hypothetical protein